MALVLFVQVERSSSSSWLYSSQDGCNLILVQSRRHNHCRTNGRNIHRSASQAQQNPRPHSWLLGAEDVKLQRTHRFWVAIECRNVITPPHFPHSREHRHFPQPQPHPHSASRCVHLDPKSDNSCYLESSDKTYTSPRLGSERPRDCL